MSAELTELKQELMIQQQKSEILELKYKLQKTQAEKASRLDDSLLSPNLYEHYQKVAVMLSKSGVIPNAYKGKPEDIFVAMAMGYQLGFPIEQSLQDIAVVNGRPCLWGDGLLSLALNHPDCQSIDEEPIIDAKGQLIGYRCTVIRKGHAAHVKQFTLQDAQMAGLLSRGTVWKAYPERMLQMRARSFAIRDKFADALRGLRIAEIEEDDARIIDVQSEAIIVQESSQTNKLKAILNRGSNENETGKIHIVSNSSDSIDGEYKSVNEYEGECSNKRSDKANKREGDDNKPDEDVPISSEQLVEILNLFEIKKFDENRISRALGYYNVESLSELSNKQAQSFLTQLEKI